MHSSLYFLTGNINKFKEAQMILPQIKQLDIDLPEIQELDAAHIASEKIKAAFKYKQARFIVEDTSLYLNALNGLPGPLVKWFIKSIGCDGLFRLAQSFGDFSAQAKTIIAYAEDKNKIHFFEGVISGKIVKPTVASPFGWDPIFKPDGHNKTFAQMSREEKTAISMRKVAFTKLKNFLEDDTHYKDPL